MRSILFAGALLLLLLLAVTVDAQNVTASGSGDSGSGSGMAGAVNCEMLRCSHGCNETTEGPLCYCPMGFQLEEDDRTCEVCPGGTWGMGCSRSCDCSGNGNPCNPTNGTCECNPCYDGVRCENDRGYDCFTDFLGIADKDFSVLSRRYGGAAFPSPPLDTRRGLVASELMEVDANIVQNVLLVAVDRAEVDQAPLAKLTWTVDFNFNRPEAVAGLARLDNKVKVGSVRGTLIVQESAESAAVTLNAGTSL